MSARPPKPTGRVTATGAALVRALLALVVIAGLLVGVPWALVRFGHWPITGMPTWRQVRELGSSGISDEAFVGVLTVALWLGWALLAVSILRELVAQLRGRPRPSFAMGPVQRAIGYLVSSLLLSVGPLTQAAGALPAPPLPVWSNPPPVASAIDFSTLVEAPEAAGPSLATHAVVTPSGTAEGSLTVTVVRGDSPWSLAETHLGDGLRWRELWEANSARAQPDGTTWGSPDSPIRPGWELVVPGVAAPAEAPGEVAGDVTVATGDNFWDLAEGELTEDWGRAPTDAEVVPHWQALVEANRDRLAPPGDPDLIFPGQLFVVPDVPADPLAPPIAEAPPPTAPTAPPAVPAPPAPGTPGTPAPPGAGSPATPAPPATETPATTATTESQRPTTTATTEAAHPTTTAADPPYTAGTYPPGPREAQPAPPAQPAAATEPDGHGDLRTAGLVAGGIALAGAVLLVDRRRRAQQRRRRPGRDVMMPPPPLRARERELRAGADVDGARLLDVALRAAAAGCGGAGLPPLRWVEVGEGAVMLSLTTALDPPPGFAAVAPDAWVTAGGANDLEAVADHPAPPLPALVPIGTSPRGTEVLVDLEASAVSTIAGPADRTLGLLRSVVAAATTSPWADQGRVLLVGAGDEMRNFPTAWVVPEFADGLREAEAYAERIAQALASLQAPSLAHARASGVDAEAWPPLVVVSAVGPTTPEEVAGLQALARRAPCGVGLVTVAGPDGEVPGRGLRIWEDGWLRVDGVDMPLQPRYLDAAAARALADLLMVAAEREDVARPAPPEAERIRRPAPPPPGPTAATVPASTPAPAAVGELAPDAPPPAAAADAGSGEPTHDERVVVVPGPAARRLDDLLVGVEVVVSVLGEVRAERRTEGGGGEPLVPSRQRALEAIAYLALRESAVDREDLEISLFPEGANSAKTIYNTVSSARSLLGEELFPPSEAGRYELSPAVVTDYGLFCELVGEADETEEAAAAADLLTEALGLVQGEPFTGVGRSYAWVGPHRGMIVAQVVDAAEELAEVRLATGDWRSAEWAARRGLRAFPADERMYRLLMRAARVAGNVSGVQRVFRELCDVIADPDLGVEPEDTLHPETVDLLEQLTGSSGSQARKGA